MQDVDLDLSDGDADENIFFSKDDSLAWSSKFPKQGRRPAANIFTEKPGVKGSAIDAESELECWQLLFTQEMIELIVQHTNQKLSVIRANYKRDVDCLPTDVTEMRALFGLLYLSGLSNLSHVHIHDLYKDNGLSPDYFRATMRENRLRLLLRALRFDDSETRAERRTTDKLAPIRQIWDQFNKNSLEHYCAGVNVIIDEMIAAFRGRCSFKQYIPSKPDKYGLKNFGMVDSETFYTSNMEVYVGQQPSSRTQLSNKPSDVVKRVCASALNSGRNITMDNWFSLIPLAIDLSENHKTTCVATLRKNKPHIPSEFLDLKKREPCSSLFGWCRNMTLVSYISKNKTNEKCVILLSSMHRSDAIDADTGEARKPEILTYYNKTKEAVNTVDQMRSKYNVARCSLRWPLTLFFAMMNIAIINAWVIYKLNSRTILPRKVFIEKLATDLTKPLLFQRLQKPHLSQDVRPVIRKCLGVSTDEPVQQLMEQGLCAYCPRVKNRKTKSTCQSCLSLICGIHTIKVCTSCYNKMIMRDSDYEDYPLMQHLSEYFQYFNIHKLDVGKSSLGFCL